MATKPRIPKPDTFSIDSKQRKANPWVDDLAKDLKAAAVGAKRASNRKKGPKLSPEQITERLDEYDKLQSEINPKEKRQKEIAKELQAHWGHTGVEEVEHTTGKTLFSLSFQLAGECAKIQSGVTDAEWRRIAKRVPQAALVIALAAGNPAARKVLEKALRVKELKLQIKPPSSRTEQSGGNESGEEAEELDEAA